MVNIGDTAPAFTLKTTDKSDVSLADYSGQTVILAFYPGAFTGVCDNGISVDSPWANAEFSRKYNLEFSLLSDLDRDVVKAYDATFTGLGGIEGYVSANRVVIVIDKNGIVQHRWVAENPGVEPDYEAIVSFASSL